MFQKHPKSKYLTIMMKTKPCRIIAVVANLQFTLCSYFLQLQIDWTCNKLNLITLNLYQSIYCLCNFLIEKYSTLFNGEICAQFNQRKFQKWYSSSAKKELFLYPLSFDKGHNEDFFFVPDCPNWLSTHPPSVIWALCDTFVALCGATCISPMKATATVQWGRVLGFLYESVESTHLLQNVIKGNIQLQTLF